MQPETMQFAKFLESLADRQCTAALWEKYAVAHYSSPLAESCRVEIIGAAINSEAWDFADPPVQIVELAQRLRAHFV